MGLANIAFNAFVNHHGHPAAAAADASRQAGNSPNTVITAAVAILGKGCAQKAIDVSNVLLEKFQLSGLKKGTDDFDYSGILKALTAEEKMKMTADKDDVRGSDALLGAIWMTLGWESLIRKTISTTTITSLPWHSKILSGFIGCSVPEDRQTEESFNGIRNDDLVKDWSFTEVAFQALLGWRPNEEELFEFSMLLGLIITNGPGTISAQGAKGAVSADGPEDPARVQINKSFIGFLTHAGFAHGGNGYEAIAFLIERFRDKGLKDPSDKAHGLDLKAIADEYSIWYRGYKAEQKSVGNIQHMKIP
jgi:hypothetical protein